MNTIILFDKVHDDRDGWRAARKGKIGGSDIATVAGLNPYKGRVQLWQEMTGRIVAPDIGENDAVWLGTELEPVVAKFYEKKTGYKLQRCECMYGREDLPWAHCTPDYFEEESGDIVEIKTVGAWAAGEWEGKIPSHLHLQVQWQLGIMGKQSAKVAAFIGGRDLVIHPVTFDPEIFEQLVGMGWSFMSAIENDIEPVASAEDLEQLKDPSEGKEITLESGRWDSDLEQYIDVKKLVAEYADRTRECKKRLSEIEAKVRQSMGDAAVALADRYVVKVKHRTRKGYYSPDASWIEFKVEEVKEVEA